MTLSLRTNLEATALVALAVAALANPSTMTLTALFLGLVGSYAVAVYELMASFEFHVRALRAAYIFGGLAYVLFIAVLGDVILPPSRPFIRYIDQTLRPLSEHPTEITYVTGNLVFSLACSVLCCWVTSLLSRRPNSIR